MPGALALALAASIKAVPVLLLGYLVYKRCWREVGWTVAFLVVLNLVVPVAIFGADQVATQWKSWHAAVGGELLKPIAHHPNQALQSALKRYLTVEGGSTNPLHTGVAAWSTAAVARVFWCLAALALAGLAWAFRRNPRDLRDRRCAGEYAICLAAMTLVSPLAWTAHFVTLPRARGAGLDGAPGDSRRHGGSALAAGRVVGGVCLRHTQRAGVRGLGLVAAPRIVVGDHDRCAAARCAGGLAAPGAPPTVRGFGAFVTVAATPRSSRARRRELGQPGARTASE